MEVKSRMQNKTELIKRVNYIVGHLRGIAKMVEEERYCVEIIKQNQAVMAALAKVNQMILKNHLGKCVVKAVESRKAAARKRVFAELNEIFKQT